MNTHPSETEVTPTDINTIEHATIIETSTNTTLANKQQIRSAQLTDTVLVLDLGSPPGYEYIPCEPRPLSNIPIQDVTLLKMINHTEQTETTSMEVNEIQREGDNTITFKTTDNDPAEPTN